MKSLIPLSQWLEEEELDDDKTGHFAPAARLVANTFQATLQLRAADLCAQLIELPPEEVEAFISAQTQGDEELRLAIESMLEQRSSAERLMEHSPVPTPTKVRGLSVPPPLLIPRFSIGDRVDDFVFLKVLGEGGFGLVYLAKQLSLDREVALKISRNLGEEARILAHLDHESIVKVYSQMVDSQKNFRILCMQYIRGVTLNDVMSSWRGVPMGQVSGGSVLQFIDHVDSVTAELESGVRKERRALSRLDLLETMLWMGVRLADALHYAHQRGVLHLDVKPSNILLDLNGRPYLTDFNVALDNRSVRNGKLTPLGGTIDYMAPEQAEYLEGGARPLKPIDHRADIYALGVVLAELLECALTRVECKFPLNDIRHAAKTGAEHPLAETMDRFHWDHVDPGTKLVLKKCIGLSPDSRFENAGVLARALEGCLQLRQIVKSLPTPFAYKKLSPFLILTCAWMVPLILAGVLSAVLTGQAFGGFPIGLPAIFMAAPFYGTLFVVWRLHFAGLRPEAHWMDDSSVLIAQGAQARHRLLGTHSVAMATATAIWLPGTVLLLSHVYSRANWSPFILGFVLVVCTLTGLTACGYASFLSQWFAMRTLYHKFWFSCTRIQEVAQEELEGLASRMRYAFLSVVLAPLLAAALAAVAPAGTIRSPELAVTGFVGLAVVGLIVASGINHRIAHFVIVFTSGGRDL